MSVESALIQLEILSKHNANYERRKPQHKDLSGEGQDPSTDEYATQFLKL